MAKISNQNPSNKWGKIARKLKLQKPDLIAEPDTHPDSSALFELATDERILSNVETILGPNLLLWTAQVLYTQPGQEKFPWHVDSASIKANGLILFMALADRTPETACPQVISGTHRCAASLEELALKGKCDLADTDSVVELADHCCPSEAPHQATSLDLKAGQYVLMTGGVWRGVLPNLSRNPGIAFVARYMTPQFADQVPNPCILVKGEDTFRRKPLAQAPGS